MLFEPLLSYVVDIPTHIISVSPLLCNNHLSIDEAAERTQMRADAIRQVAMGLAAASSSSAQRAGITDPGLQQQYRDAILNTSSSPFLQGFASRDSSFGQQQSSMYSSAAAEGTGPPLPGVVGDDANFREQVYMAAARMQMQQPQEAQAKSSGRTQEAAKSSPKSSPKRKRLPTSSSKAKSSSHKKSGASPSLPKAPLVLPTKKAQGKVKCEEGDGIPSGKPKPVKHVYHDYSAVPDCEEFTRKKTGGVSMPFPDKLMDMLDKESVLHPDIISWCSHGRAFIVRKPKVFTSDIMGEYFKQSKLTSFQRQLNLYGFRRITQGPDASAYYHELFLRGRPQLCMRMQRQKVKGTGHKQPTDVSTEPNFYAMPKLEGESEGKTVAMEEVAVSVGAGDNTSLPSLFLLGQSNSNPPPPYAPPDGQLNAQYPLSYLNSPGIQAATMLRRLSASNVNAPPFSLSAGSTYQDTNTAGTTTFQPSAISESCALANAAASAMTSLGNDESDHGSVASKTHSTKEGTKMEYV